ncbi:MAG: MFS transporter [Clostridia bacterium]|nr:MFS transporter [Clostridia bacterium]
MKTEKFAGMRPFVALLLTQSLSALGSSMTAFALIVWSYSQRGSALDSALLSVCSYAPYVMMSILAGALSDRWDKKRTLLVCDALAACTTVMTLILFETGKLEIWHLYVLNALNGLMNSVQRPASDVAVSLLVPRENDQQASALRSTANSMVNIITPTFAAALMAFSGLRAVIVFDLATFACAFLSLLLLIRIPAIERTAQEKEGLLDAAKQGLAYLRRHPGVFHIMLFLAAINLTASMFEAALPALVLSKTDETALGLIKSTTGVTLLAGSLTAAMLRRPKSRVRVICNTLLLSMSTENFLLGLGGSNVLVWCLGAVLGWIAIPLMNANLDALLRGYIPIGMQGRVFSVRNSFQFFTIPIGYLLGGVLVDSVFEPMMAAQAADSLLVCVFGAGKGAGAAVLFFLLGILGVVTCLVFRRDKAIWALEQDA